MGLVMEDGWFIVNWYIFLILIIIEYEYDV